MNQVAIFFRVCATVLFVSLSQAANATRPNILFICVDDFKPLLGCYGDQT